MTFLLRGLLAALTLTITPTAHAARPTKPTAPTARIGKGAKPAAVPKAPAVTEPAPAPIIIPSAEAQRVVDWVSTSRNNFGLPWAVIDKAQAALFLFDAKGKPLAAVPVLIGIASGDEASPGVGSKKLADLGPAEKTTPAGRYLAKFGLPVGGERVLWVDYANSVAVHPIPADAGAKEKRRERMLSPEPDDNRITFGCINVPKAFYTGTLRPQFRRKGGYIYIMPDTKPLEDVFPRLRVEAVRARQAAG